MRSRAAIRTDTARAPAKPAPTRIAPRVQPQLRIGPVDDPLEREADRIADAVMAGGAAPGATEDEDPTVRRACCSACEAHGDDEHIRRKPAGAAGPAPASSAPQAAAAIATGGAPLPAPLRSYFEPRFGRDLSGVRVHTDTAAATAAAAIDARAFTLGHRIAFARGEYAPATDSGRRLIAHEIAHVAQQSPAVVRRQPAGAHPSPPRRHPHVDLIEISCGSMAIVFRSSEGQHRYALTQCDVTDGEYDAGISRNGGNITFNLGTAAAAGRRFFFSWGAPAPGQTTPAQLLSGQSSVHIWAHQSSIEGDSAGGSAATEERVVAQAEVTYVADEVDAPLPFSLGAPFLSTGMAGFPSTISDDLVFTTGSPSPQGSISFAPATRADRFAAGRRMLSPRFWDPLVPRRNLITLDRILNELPRDLTTRLETELANRAPGAPLAWTRRGFTEAELMSIPDLVHRLNREGVGALSTAERGLLVRAASQHLGGASPGAPFASYMTPDFDLPFNRTKSYRVRVEVSRVDILDTSGPNDFTRLSAELNNAEEAEFMLAARRHTEPRLIGVTRNGAGASNFFVRNAGRIRWGGRVLGVVGAAISVGRIATAEPGQHLRVAAEEGAGLAFGAAGTAIATAGCVAFGVATGGLGLFACGLLGGAAMGALGSWGAGSLFGGEPEPHGGGHPATRADLIEFNQAWSRGERLRAACPGGGCHASPPGPGLGGIDLFPHIDEERMRDFIDTLERERASR